MNELNRLFQHSRTTGSSTYRLNPEDVVLGVGVVCQRRHPAELPVEQVQDGGGVEHLLLEPLQEAVVLLSETLGHGQRFLQLLLQRALQRFLPGAVCEGNRLNNIIMESH